MDQLYLSLEHKNTISSQVIRLAESLVLSAWSASAETLQEQQKYSHIQIRPSFSHTQSWKQGNIKSWLKDSRSLFNLFFLRLNQRRGVGGASQSKCTHQRCRESPLLMQKKLAGVHQMLLLAQTMLMSSLILTRSMKHFGSWEVENVKKMQKKQLEE